MLQLLQSPARRKPHAPQLSVKWESRGHSFRESLQAFFASAKPIKNAQAPNCFRDSYIRPYWPFRSFVASLLWHAAFIGLLIAPIWNFRTHRMRLAPVQIEVTWNQPAPDLVPLTHPGTPAQPSPAGKRSKPMPRSGADAFHPRQTILSTQRRPTHPRQTLIQPGAPPTPPKISRRLPNITQWSQASGAPPPKLYLSLSLARPHGRRRRSQRAGMPPAPELQNQAKSPGLLNFAAGPAVNPEPKLPISATTTPRLVSQQKPDNVKAPEIGSGATTDAGPLQLNLSATNQNVPQPKLPGGSSASPTLNKKATADAGPAPDLGLPSSDTGRQIVALSANPAPPASVTNVPQGNLSAKVAISPEGTHPGVPGGSPTGVAGGTGSSRGGPSSTGGTGGAGGRKPGPGGGGAGASGPTGVSITGGNPKTASSVAGPGSTTAEASKTPARINAPRANTRSATAQPAAPDPMNPTRTQPTLGMERIDAGASPEQIFGSKGFYTTYVNMPNLTSATGSWVLNFAELQIGEERTRAGGDPSSPVPMRKVDPKYPPTLINAHVEGEVVLYAIIRRDGSVDSIQLIKGVDPQLDQNAMEAFARWRFRPALHNGVPVDLETVVHIPFRASPTY